MIDREKHLEEDKRAEANENNQSKVSEANVNIACGDGNKNDEASRTLKQPQQPSVKLATNTYGSGGKRKRLLWTEKEEEALRAGVEIFSKEPIKNVPWRKILGLGLFDKTRTPNDLKDKWKNMRKGTIIFFIILN
ncbi:hypothetical protein DH2020_011353 [Rehmannia glutinosa]|uniref:Myb-like domain-containing protein n=1 Tax=Rehmannia glutinosa TaxID=99300 RepID=A0ABR0XD48_REHGL